MKRETKNRILLAFICIVTLFALFLTIRLNKNRLQDLSDKSYVSGYLTEITYESINDYVVENPNAIIYVSDSNDSKSTEFEKIFSKAIKKYNLESSIYYININDTNIVDLFYQNAPEIVIYKDGAVSEVIDANTISTYDELIKAFKERSIINE